MGGSGSTSLKVSEILQHTLDTTTETLCLVDDSGVIVAANRARAAALQLDIDAIVHRNVADLGDALPIDPALIRRSLREGPITTILNRPSGPTLLSIRPVATAGLSRRYVAIALQDIARLAEAIGRIHDQNLAKTRQTLRDGRDGSGTVELIGNGVALLAVRTLAARYAEVDTPVLILGETGTGKGLFARFIHETSPRRGGPLVEVNCASLPPTLLEAELFGYAKGAFTGADPRGKRGLLALAEGGTVLLDEIGDLPMPLQAKLLRFLEEGEVWPVGAVRPVRPDVRVVAATNRELTKLIHAGEFRPDLFYRLNVLVLNIPPLRHRREDIPLLIEMMTARLQERLGRIRTLTRAAIEALSRHDYPGNVRELWNVLERSFVTASGQVIDVLDILLDPVDGGDSRAKVPSTLRYLDAPALREALQRHPNQRAAARALGVSQATVSRRARRYGLL